MGINGHWYIESEKQGYWRGNVHTYVNRYIMSGATPSAADALSVINTLTGIEGALMPPVSTGLGVGFVQARAYPSGSGTYFQEKNFNTDLVPSTATGYAGPSGGYTSLGFAGTLENCLVLETRLQGLSSTGKPIFLRKYYRGIFRSPGEASAANPISSADLAKIATTTAPFQTGMGSSNWVVIGSSGAQAASAPAALQYIGNRQVPKGRKKKAASANILTRIVRLGESDPEALALAALASE